MVLEPQVYATASKTSWTYSQVIHEVHVRVPHQQKQSQCDTPEVNYEDRSRHKCWGKCLMSFSSDE